MKSNNQFKNLHDIKMSMSSTKLKSMIKDYMGDEIRVPPFTLPTKKINIDKFKNSDTIAWLGHSTILGNINGVSYIVDPMLSNRASPIYFAGPKRFDGTQIDIESLPNIDIILITHNHYDHLDYKTIMILANRVNMIYLPLNTAHILKKWGVDSKKLKEFNWYDEVYYNSVFFAFTPTQHFSGRGLLDRDKSLWGSWVIKSEKSSIYISGDSGYNSHFQDIGKKYGEFDIACMECGAYSPNWKEIHMLPYQSVQASIDLKSQIILPIHWAGFNLSTHTWDEPIELVIQEAERKNIDITTPMIGEVIKVYNDLKDFKWWRDSLFLEKSEYATNNNCSRR